MKLLRIAVAAAATAAFLAGTACAGDWKTIRIATEGAYLPWNGTDPAGKLIGFEIELAAELCKRAGATCTVTGQDWDGLIPAMQQGKYDAIMAGMSITDERKKLIAFSSPYAADPVEFAAMKGSPLLAIPATTDRIGLGNADGSAKTAFAVLAASLKGKTVGVQVSTIHQSMMEKHLPEVTLRTYDKVDSMALDLESGRIDAIVADKSSVGDLMKSDAGKAITPFGPLFVGGVLGEGIGVGLRQADGDLKGILDKAIAAATADGTITKLADKWFGYDVAVK